MLPPSRSSLLGWLQSGHLSQHSWPAALRLIGLPPTDTQWQRLLERLLLTLGLVCIASGLFFFIAFNWQLLGRLPRLLLVALPLVLVCLLLWRRALTPAAVQGLTLFAGLNLGALLALIGQTYQSGADPWQLFALWALLLLPWAWLSQSTPLTALAWLLAQLALARYWHLGLLDALFSFSAEGMAWLLVAGNALLWGALSRLPSAQRLLPAFLPALACGLGATLLVLLNLFETTSAWGWLAWGIWLVVAYCAWHQRFVTGLALAALSVICVSLVGVGKYIEADAGGMLLLGIQAIVLSVIAVRWLAQQRGDSHE